jgi:pilus assembly protein CpaE
MIQLLDQLGIPLSRRKIILNRFSNFPGNLKPADVAMRCASPVDHIVPYEKKVLIAANLGRPLILDTGRFSGFGRALRGLIDEVAQQNLTVNAVLQDSPQFAKPRGEESISTNGHSTSNGNGAVAERSGATTTQ